MAHSNKQFIINLVIASLISLALVSFSMAPAYLFLIKNNWFMITIGFVIYALEAWGLYWLYWHTARVRHYQVATLKSQVNIAQLGTVIIAMLTMVVLIIVDLKLSAMLNIPETSNSRSLAWMLGEAPLPMIVSVVIFSPICEELIFRGIFFSYALTNQYNHRNYQMIAVVINSLIFASVHVDANWEPWIYYTLMGGILGTTYLLAKRDIRMNILVHMGTNLAVFALAAMS